MKTQEIICEYQPYIDYAPTPSKKLFSEACESDDVTINSWRKTWEKNVQANHDKYGSFADHSIGKFFGTAHMQPVVIVGSGPSLKDNIKELKNRKSVQVISCLHNFHIMEDNDVPPDFYVSLDAGDVTVEEVYEGGSKTEQEYWDLTKNRKLLCYIGTNPKLLDKWQGEVYFFNAPVPDEAFMKFLDTVEVFNTYVSNGGNVLGACLYIAKAYLGASVIGFVGADFCFSYKKKFHGWDSKYDANLGNVLRVKDVFGNSVYTWKSYHNFKGWFEWVSLTVAGIYYNCTEGGTLGAYPEGNIRSIRQLPLRDFLAQMTIYEEIKEQALNPKCEIKKLLF
jgi:hypothetical protein